MPEIRRHQTLAQISDWSERLWALEARAEKLAAAAPTSVSVEARAALASDAGCLLWLALTPAVVAASCKASALLGEPLLCSVPPVEAQMFALNQLRLAGVLNEPELPDPAEPAEDDEPAEVDEPADVADDDHQGDEPQGIEAQPTEQWLTRPQLAELLGVSDGAVRAWVCKRWLIEGQHWVTDPSNRRRLLYDAAACREVVAQRSRKLRGLAAQTPEGAEERRLLRVQRQNARRERARQGKAVQVEGEVEPVEQGGESEPAAGGRLEGLLAALLAEVRSQG
jgi:hypothetical protein